MLKVATTHTYDDGLGYRPRPPHAVVPTFEILQGVRFRQILQLMKFNPNTGRAEPLTLPEGAEVRMQLRKRPRHQVDITLRHDESGRETTRTITLTEDESEALDAAPEEDHELLLKDFKSLRNGFNELAADISRDSSGGLAEASAPI